MPVGPDVSPRSPFAVALGQRIRRLRRAEGLTQAQLGAPLRKAFVSAVELGRVVPSLRALAVMAARLRVPIAVLIPDNSLLSGEYTAARASDHTPPDRRR